MPRQRWAEAPAELELARIAKLATISDKAWRAYRDANVTSQTKQENRDGKGSARTQKIPRSHAVPTPGRWESNIALGRLLDGTRAISLWKKHLERLELLDETQGSIF